MSISGRRLAYRSSTLSRIPFCNASRPLEQFLSGNQDKGMSSIDSGFKLLNHRMRCLKITDSSPAGWETVKEYVSSPLSINDEDDKRLKSAEKIATERLKTARIHVGGGEGSDFVPEAQTSVSTTLPMITKTGKILIARTGTQEEIPIVTQP